MRVQQQRDTALHRIWMIRNYALTLAGVTLRVYLGIGVAVMAAVRDVRPANEGGGH